MDRCFRIVLEEVHHFEGTVNRVLGEDQVAPHQKLDEAAIVERIHEPDRREVSQHPPRRVVSRRNLHRAAHTRTPAVAC